MSVQITLSVPDALYHQAQQAAQRSQQPLEVLLTDILLGAFSPFASHPQQAAMEREEHTWEALRPHLTQDYLGEVVALHEGAVVDHDADEVALVSRIEACYPDQAVLVRRVTPEPPPPPRFRSPRFVRDL